MTAREFEEELARAVQDLSIDAVKALPEPIKKPLRQAVGRVATNVIEPVGYSYTSFDQHSGIKDVSKLDQTMGLFAPRNIAHTISSLVQDKPAYNDAVLPGLPPDMPPDPIYSSRRPLFREYFDLPTQDTTNAFVHSGKDYWINPDTKNQVARETMQQFKGGPGATPSGFLNVAGTDYNAISGSYIAGQPDPWNFDLHPEEAEYAKDTRFHLKSGIYGRLMLEALGNPAVLHTGGYVNKPPNEEMLPNPPGVDDDEDSLAFGDEYIPPFL